MKALDRVELLRAPVRMPKWAISHYWLDRGRKRAQLTDSQWMIDHCLRECKVSPTGYVPAKEYTHDPTNDINTTRFWLTGTGSTVPLVGNYDNFTAQEFVDTEGSAGEMYTISGAKPDSVDGPLPLCFAAHTSDYYSRYWSDNPSGEEASYTHFVAVNLVTRNDEHFRTNGAPLIRIHMQDANLIEMYVSDGQVRGRWYEERANISHWSSWYTLPTDANAQDSIFTLFTTEWSPQNGLRMYFEFNGVNTGWENLSPDSYPGTGNYYAKTGLIEVARVVEFNDLAYQRNNWFDAPFDAATLVEVADYFAALDTGRNRLTYMPEKDGKQAWDIIKEVAAAEFGAVFWDEAGTFRFWNYDTIASKRNTIVRDATIDQLESLRFNDSLSSVRNVYSVELTHKLGVFGTVVEIEDPFYVYVPGHTRKQIQFDRGSCTYPRPFPVVQHDTLGDEGSGFPQWSDATVHAYVPQWLDADEPGWAENQFRDAEGGNTFCYVNRDGFIELDYSNGWAEEMRFATDPTASGGESKGALRILGSYVDDQSNTVFQIRNEASVDQYGTRTLELSGDWYQDRFQTERMLEDIITRTGQPIPVTDDITLPGDPRLQLADTIRLKDPSGFGVSMPFQCYGIRQVFTADDGFTTELAGEIVEPPGHWILGHPVYSVLGETTVL